MKTKQLPNGWREVELEEIFDFENKTGIKAGEGLEEGKYKFFTSSGNQSKFLDKFNFRGEHLIFSTGGRAGLHYCNEPFSISNDCFVVKVNNKILTKYVYYYLFSKIYLLEEGFKGAGLKHLSRSHLLSIKLIYPENKEVQKQIVSILEKAEKLKHNREDADKLTKEYLQSVFSEMFGNYLKDKKNYKKIMEFVPDDKNAIKAGPFGSSLKKECYVDKGYKIYGQEQVIKDDLNFGDYYIPQEKYEELKNYKVQEGDILISLVGTCGRISIVPKNFELGIINPRLMKITLDKQKMNPVFFKYLFNSEAIKKELTNSSHGGTMDIINVGIIKKIGFPLPPLPLQKKFASIVEKVEKLKEKQKKSKEEIGEMFDSLMQKAFKGELVR